MRGSERFLRRDAREAFGDVVVELVPPAVTHRTERVDRDHAAQPVRMRGREMEREVSAPRVPDRLGTLDPNVSARNRVSEVYVNVVRLGERARREPTLLVADRAHVARKPGDERLAVVRERPPWRISAGSPDRPPT